MNSNNHIILDGNHNIVIQDAQGSHIYVNSEEGVRQLLAEQGDQIKQVLKLLQAQKDPLLQQFAEKIYQIGKIDTAHFHIYGDRSIKKHLTPPPFIPELFMGRELDLKTIYKKLFSGDNLLLLVNGQGGIGKTTLAAKYWEKYQDQYCHVAWVFAGNSLLDALLTLAQELELSFPEAMPNVERLPLLLKALSNLNKPCLLVIDNANDLKDMEKNYLALRSCSNFHLLLTTRITEFEQAAFHQIQPLESKVAIDLFQTHYPKYQASEQPVLEEILEAVGHNTLVIELLAKNLRNWNKHKEQYSLAELLADLQKKGLLALSKTLDVKVGYQAKGAALRKERPEAIIAAMYDLGELNTGEKRLLAAFAVLPAEKIAYEVLRELLRPVELPQNKLKKSFWQRWFSFSKPKPQKYQLSVADFEQGLQQLAQKGWLDYEEEEALYKVSPVVQEIVCKKNETLLADCEGLIDALIEKLDYEPGTGHFLNANYSQAAMFVRYGEMLVGCFAEVNDGIAILCERLGSFHQTRDNLPQALQFFERYKQLKKQLFEAYPDNKSFKNGLAISYEKLGQTHADLGNLAQALHFFNEGLAIGKELFNVNSSNVEFTYGLAMFHKKLGQLHMDFDNLELALKHYEEFHELSLILHEGTNSNSVDPINLLAISYEKLGVTFSAIGNQNKAIDFFEKGNKLFLQMTEVNPNNLDFKYGLAVSYANLSKEYLILENFQKAQDYAELDCDLSAKLTVEFSENITIKNGLAVSLANLGVLHFRQGNFENAILNFEQSMVIFKELTNRKNGKMEFQSRYADSLAVLNSLQILTLKSNSNALTLLAHQIFEELFLATNNHYYSRKREITTQMIEKSFDLHILIRQIIEF